MTMAPLLATLAFVLDVTALAIMLAGAWILVTTGGALHIGGLYIRAYTLRNPALFFAVVVCLRALLVSRAPHLFAVRSWDLRGLPRAVKHVTDEPGGRMPRGPRRVLAFVVAIIAISTAIKLLNAWVHFGFFSGDDVEIQEMSFSHLFGYEWHAWNLRNAFYPLVFIYPVQKVLHLVGVGDTAVLVFAGRAVVALFAAITMWLVFLTARRQFASVGVAACAVTFLALNKLHVAFASTELPRPVSAAFLAGAYMLLLDGSGMTGSIGAAVLLGIAASLRFSEAIFFVPAVLMLALAGRWRHAIVVAIVASATTAFIVGLSDALYWKEPFFSARNIVDYTLVKGLSSRGYQSGLYYFTSLGDWTNLVTASFALVGMRHAPRLALWFAIPLIVLSCLPHKEARYLVPLMPFYAMLAAVGFWNVATAIVGGRKLFTGWTVPATVMVVASALVLAPLELEGFRFRRSESAVEVARFLADRRVPVTIGFEDTFRAGGSLYLRQVARLHQLDPVLVRQGPEAIIGRVREANLDYVALADEDFRAHGYEGAFPVLGFTEVDFGGRTPYGRFRLFKRCER